MKILKTSLLILSGALIFGACNYTGQSTPATTAPVSGTPTTAAFTPTPTPTPSPVQSYNDLNTQLGTTVDDGGAADLNNLKTQSQGL